MKALPKGLSVIEHKNQLLAKLYNTTIADVNLINGDVTINSGLRDIGRLSKHTKKCLNLVLADSNISVRQKDFKWIISHKVDNFTKFFYLDTQGIAKFNIFE
jgi:hypothetical protein